MLLSTFFDHVLVGASQRGISPSQAARLCLDAGVTGLEVLSSRYHEASLDLLNILRKEGMHVTSYPAFTDLIHDPSDAVVEETVRRAASIEAQGILLIPGFLAPGEDRVQAMERSLPAVMKMCRLANEEGMYVGMEDFDNESSPVSDSDGLMWYLDRIPALACVFDTGNFHYIGEDTLSAYQKLRSRIGPQVHLKDRSLTPRPCDHPGHSLDGRDMYPCAVGEGDMPIGEILSDLSASGFDGSLTIELFAHPDCLSGILESVRFIRKFFPEA